MLAVEDRAIFWPDLFLRWYKVWSCCSHLKKMWREICLMCAPRSWRDGNGEREGNFGFLFIIRVLISCTLSHNSSLFLGAVTALSDC